MASFSAMVNQKTVFARLLLHQAQQADGQRHLQQALLQSVALQLRLGYRFYLGEVGDTYKCPDPQEFGDLWTLIANLQLQGKNPAETMELYNLNEGGSWLSDLQDCCEAISSLPEPGAVAPADPNRIPAFSSARRHDWSALTCPQLEGWVRAFEEMVERHRQSMVEW